MRDTEIIKALEPYKSTVIIRMADMSWSITFGDVIDLIKRYEAENERLKAMNQAKLDMIHDIRARVEVTKAEAIKEFAERLKNMAVPVSIGGKYNYKVVTTGDIDNLVKEMVGDNE